GPPRPATSPQPRARRPVRPAGAARPAAAGSRRMRRGVRRRGGGRRSGRRVRRGGRRRSRSAPAVLVHPDQFPQVAGREAIAVTVGPVEAGAASVVGLGKAHAFAGLTLVAIVLPPVAPLVVLVAGAVVRQAVVDADAVECRRTALVAHAA